MAKKDGEIASLRRDLRPATKSLQALVRAARAGQRASGTGELRELEDAVSTLTSRAFEGRRREAARGAHGEGRECSRQRIDTLSTTVVDDRRRYGRARGRARDDPQAARFDRRRRRSTAGELRQDLALAQRLNGVVGRRQASKTLTHERAAEPDRPSEELRTMLATLRSQVEALSGLSSAVTEEQLDERFAETDSTLIGLSETDRRARRDRRVGDHEPRRQGARARRAPSTLHRVERSASNPSSTTSARRCRRCPRSEPPRSTTSSPASSGCRRLLVAERPHQPHRDGHARGHRDARADTDELAAPARPVDQRLATVATEVARAKTLWPVACGRSKRVSTTPSRTSADPRPSRSDTKASRADRSAGRPFR